MECKILKKYQSQQDPFWKGKTIADFLLVIAKLGGYLGRKNDWPPGNIVIWRGIRRLNDICIGYKLSGENIYG